MRLLAWWRARRARRAFLAGPHYVDQIQVLKAAGDRRAEAETEARTEDEGHGGRRFSTNRNQIGGAMFETAGRDAAGPMADMNSALAQAASRMPGQTTRANIPQILDEQVGSLTGLHKMISELENRLAQVLAHDGPTAESSNRIDPPPPTQIAERLVMNNRGIDIAQQRIGQLIQRLHL